jgi:hypothetical protein
VLQGCSYVLYGSDSLSHDVLIASVSCHGLRPPNHLCVLLLYDKRTGVDQCLWLSLVVDRIGYLSTRFLGESLVSILRENSGRTEELIGYWVSVTFWFVYSHQVFGP